MRIEKPTSAEPAVTRPSDTGSLSHELTVAVVVLTTGDREAELRALARSLDGQDAHERILINNGGEPVELDGWSQTVLPENIGVPAGRSWGARTSTADVLVYVDDDSLVISQDLLSRVAQRFEQRPDLGALGFRVQSTAGGPPMRRWTPASSAPAADGVRASTTFPGNGHALRRAAFLDVGGYCDELFFKHEETNLSWRLLDRGWEVGYDERCLVEHPATPEGRHATALYMGARNKVWMARLALPAVLVPISVAVTVARYTGRCRRIGELTKVAGGIRAGFRRLPAERVPMQWRTVWLLTKRGRPPVL